MRSFILTLATLSIFPALIAFAQWDNSKLTDCRQHVDFAIGGSPDGRGHWAWFKNCRTRSGMHTQDRFVRYL